MSKLFALLLAGVILSSTAYAADPAKEKADFQRRLDSVKALTSSLQRDNDAGTPAVKEALAAVAARQKEAEELAAVGEYEVARTILDEGYKKLTATLMKAKSGEGYQQDQTGMVGMTGSDGQLLSVAKAKADFTRNAASADAMLDAAKRTDAAKGGKHSKEIATLEAQIAEAKRTAAAGDLKKADALLKEVALKEKQMIAANAGGSSSPTAEMSGMTGSDGQLLSVTKSKADFERKLMSAASLLDAAKRVDGEKGNSHKAEIAALEADLIKAKGVAGANDFAGANQLIDGVLSKEKALIASTKTGDAATANLKTGSNQDQGTSGMSGEEKKAELAKTLRSTAALRDLVARRSQERSIDNAATLAKIDQLVSEARRQEASDINRAYQSAGSAYDTAKAAMESLRSK